MAIKKGKHEGKYYLIAHEDDDFSNFYYKFISLFNAASGTFQEDRSEAVRHGEAHAKLVMALLGLDKSK